MNKDQKAKEWRELKAAEAAFFRSLQFLSERVRRARRESLVCRAQFWGGRSAARLDSHVLLPRFPVVSMAVNRRAGRSLYSAFVENWSSFSLNSTLNVVIEP